jgi:hypothetical protein
LRDAAANDPSLASEEPIIVRLCSFGSLTLSPTEKRNGKTYHFIVSPDMLILASSFFAKLLQGDMAEALAVRSGDTAPIYIYDDDVDAVEVVLRILHHGAKDLSIAITMEIVAAIAMLSDKWGCLESIRPWVSRWLLSLPHKTSTVDIGQRLVTAYFIRDPADFEVVTKMAIQTLSPDFLGDWFANDLHSLLPASVHGELSVNLQIWHRLKYE